MLTGLMHLHKTLGYLVGIAAVLQLVFALAGGASRPERARLTRKVGRFGMLMSGRFTVLIGLYLWMATSYGAATSWIWVSLVLWCVVEGLGVRVVKPALVAVEEGKGMLLGVVGQLLCIVAITGLMTVRP